jgi:hypothetical protein
MTVGAATERFIEDCKGRHLAKETVGKYELLAKELKAAFFRSRHQGHFGGRARDL